jgi:tetratricopeptide (TPR) repeat protein
MPEEKSDKRRKYARIKVPEGMFVGWKSPGRPDVSRTKEMGLGGMFLYTAKPAPVGTTVQLLFDVSLGEVRARAVVRYLIPGTGMGLQFVQMLPEHRARLNQFLTSREAAPAGTPGHRSARPAAQPDTPTPAGPAEHLQFERELIQLLEVAEKGTYYQLLGVTTEATSAHIKKNFYSLARKYHPDHHMARADLVQSLQNLMAVVIQAYLTLTDEKKRAVYDKNLPATAATSHHRGKTKWQEELEESVARANECLRAKNFAGSIIWLRKCATIAPNNSRYHAMLARSLGTFAEYRDEAAAHYQAAIDLDPLNIKVHLQFAEFCEQIQLHSRARRLYAKILEIDPTHAKTLEMIAQLDSRGKAGKSSSVISRMFSKKS